jgi:hypothetical protein
VETSAQFRNFRTDPYVPFTALLSRPLHNYSRVGIGTPDRSEVPILYTSVPLKVTVSLPRRTVDLTVQYTRTVHVRQVSVDRSTLDILDP